MVDASSPRNVTILRDYYEGGVSMNSSSVPNAYNEYEQQVISKGLKMRVKEVEQKSVSKKEPTAMDSCRPTSSIEKQACEESAVEEEGKSRSHADIAPRDKDRQRLQAATFGGVEVHELEWKNEQADRETKELVSQIEQCELAIEGLHEQVNILKAREIRLLQCGEEIKEDLTDQIKDLREKLRDSKHRERELQAQLQRSRQVQEDLRIELSEAKLKAIEQLRQNEERERELELLQYTRRQQGQVSLETLQQLVEATAENISQRSSSAANTQQFIYQRHPGDIDTIAQQNRQISYLEQAKHHAERKAQKSALETRQANLEAEYIRKELTESRKREQQKGEKVFALSRQPGRGGITGILAYTQT